MKPNQALAYIFALAAFLLAVYAYSEDVYSLKFLDRVMYQVEFASRRLAYIFIVVSAGFILLFVYMGLADPRKKISRMLSVTIAIYVLSVAVCGAYRWWLPFTYFD